MRTWEALVDEALELGFEFHSKKVVSVYRHGVLIAEDVDLTEARQLVIRALREGK